MITAKYKKMTDGFKKSPLVVMLIIKKAVKILCAAVSASTLVTANAIEHLALNHLIDLTVDEGYFKISLKEPHDIIEKLLDNLEYTLHDFEKQYPKYIKNQKEG